jgi:hypothetical protein
MKRAGFRSALAAVAVMAACVADAAAQQAVTLRSAIESTGPGVTLGDFFADAGAASGRVVAPPVPTGQTRTFSPRFVQAAANAAGLDWTPPQGMTAILVAGGGGAGVARRQTIATSAASTPGGDIAVRRGETVELTYVTPGIRLTTRARAASDGAVGDTVRLVNLQSNRTVEAVVTGAGAAAARTN